MRECAIAPVLPHPQQSCGPFHPLRKQAVCASLPQQFNAAPANEPFCASHFPAIAGNTRLIAAAIQCCSSERTVLRQPFPCKAGNSRLIAAAIQCCSSKRIVLRQPFPCNCRKYTPLGKARSGSASCCWPRTRSGQETVWTRRPVSSKMRALSAPVTGKSSRM